jgi:hypothetical protein
MTIANNRKIGMLFEAKIDKRLQELAFQTCTPRKTAQLIGQRKGTFCIHRDFFSDETHPGLDGLAIRPDYGMIGWQCKRDFAQWGPGKKNKLLTALCDLQETAKIPIYIAYESMGLHWFLKVGDWSDKAVELTLLFQKENPGLSDRTHK